MKIMKLGSTKIDNMPCEKSSTDATRLETYLRLGTLPQFLKK